FVETGPQRYCLLVDRPVGDVGLEVVLGDVEDDTFLDGIDVPAAGRGDLGEDVQNSVHHAVFVLELKVAVRHLNRDRSQHALVRHAAIICAHVKRQELCGKPASDHGCQVLE